MSGFAATDRTNARPTLTEDEDLNGLRNMLHDFGASRILRESFNEILMFRRSHLRRSPVVCIYAHNMDVAALLFAVRESSGVPIRRLADDADVAGSTITRIQAGVVDPSVGTLQRILAAAGFDLVISAVRHGMPRQPGLADLTRAWSVRDGDVRLLWPQWRGFLDRLALHPELVAEAIFPVPPPSGHRVVDALIAAVAEKLADDAVFPRPSWTGSVPGLIEPYRPRTARQIAGRDVPQQLSDRGLLIDAESLWRQPETIGV